MVPTRPFDFGHVLHEPVDGVVSVGRMVDRGRVQGAAQGAVHDILALRPIFAAHVLVGDDISGADQFGRQRREDALGQRAEVAAGLIVGRIRGAVEHDGGAARIFRQDQHGEQFHPVAHRDHHRSADILEAGARGIEGARNVAGPGEGRGLNAMEFAGDVAAGLNRGLNVGLSERGRSERERNHKAGELRRHDSAPQGASLHCVVFPASAGAFDARLHWDRS